MSYQDDARLLKLSLNALETGVETSGSGHIVLVDI